MKVYCLVITTLLLILNPACSSNDCEKECTTADSCPNFSGVYFLGGNITQNACGTLASTSALLVVQATVGNAGTDLNVVLNTVNMKGKLCNTTRTSYPLVYDFSATASQIDGKTTIVDSLSGQFVVNEGGTKNICANYFHQESGEDAPCFDSMVLSTNAAVCH